MRQDGSIVYIKIQLFNLTIIFILIRWYITDALQFKNANDNLNKTDHGVESVMSIKKPETRIADRNQYSMGSDSMGVYNFGRDHDTDPEIKDTGIEFK